MIKQIKYYFFIIIVYITACKSEPQVNVFVHPSTDWMAGKWGLMVHWIAPGPAPAEGKWISDLNTAVNNFQTEKFLNQFDASGAEYLMFTIGQNTSKYCSPNKVMDQYAGKGHCSDRDLALEIALGVKRLGKKFILYLPAEVDAPVDLHVPFAWNSEGDQTEFEKRYTEFVKEYSVKFGKNYDGWWFDGCYSWPAFPNSTYNWPLWMAAARAGNPNALVAFNNSSFYGGLLTPTTPFQDYLSGECWKFKDGQIVIGNQEPTYTFLPNSRYVKFSQCQFHVQTPIDCNKYWVHDTPGKMPPPSYTDEELFSTVLNVLKVGGAVTLNVGIYQEGYISDQTLEQLKRLNLYLKENLN